MTLVDLMDWLKTLDELTLLELLDIQSDEIVERFGDKIEADFNRLSSEKESMNGF